MSKQRSGDLRSVPLLPRSMRRRRPEGSAPWTSSARAIGLTAGPAEGTLPV